MFNPESPPDFIAAKWFNTDGILHLSALRGRVVLAMAFQMLCPGSLEYGVPLAKRLAARFNPKQIAVIGLHLSLIHI